MMDITLTTPALLFPAVTFLLVAYTSRFLAISARIRALHDKYQTTPDDILLRQIMSLRKRVSLIRNMQACGVTGLFFCVSCMFVIFAGMRSLGNIMFGMSLLLFFSSMGRSLTEIQLSAEALNLELQDIENKKGLKPRKDTK